MRKKQLKCMRAGPNSQPVMTFKIQQRRNWASKFLFLDFPLSIIDKNRKEKNISLNKGSRSVVLNWDELSPRRCWRQDPRGGWGKGCYRLLVHRGQGLASLNAQDGPQQRIIWPQMSAELRLRICSASRSRTGIFQNMNISRWMAFVYVMLY